MDKTFLVESLTTDGQTHATITISNNEPVQLTWMEVFCGSEFMWNLAANERPRFYYNRTMANFLCSPHTNSDEFDRWFSRISSTFTWHFCAPTGCLKDEAEIHKVKSQEELFQKLFHVQINKTETYPSVFTETLLESFPKELVRLILQYLPAKPRYSYDPDIRRYAIDTCRFQDNPGPQGQCLWFYCIG